MILNLTFVSLFATSKNPQGHRHPSPCQISGPQSTRPAKMYSSILFFKPVHPNPDWHFSVSFDGFLLFLFAVFASGLWLSQQSVLCSSKCAQNPDCHCRPSVDRDLWDVTLSGMKKKRTVALHVLPRRLSSTFILACSDMSCSRSSLCRGS